MDSDLKLDILLITSSAVYLDVYKDTDMSPCKHTDSGKITARRLEWLDPD